MSKQHYALTWDILGHNPPIARDKLPEGRGACDSILVASILHVDGQEEMLDGGTSTGFLSQNGCTGKELTPGELFQIWSALAHDLTQKLPEGGRKKLCERVMETIRDALNKPAPKEDPNMETPPNVVHDILLLTDYGEGVSLAQVEQWTPDQREEVADWAGAVHLNASDNDDVEIPETPEVLLEWGHYNFFAEECNTPTVFNQACPDCGRMRLRGAPVIN